MLTTHRGIGKMKTMKIDIARIIPFLVLLSTLDPAGALLRGFDSAERRAEETAGTSHPMSNDCKIQVATLLEIPDETPDDFEDLVFECELDPADAPDGQSNVYKRIEGTESQMKDLKDMLNSGDLVAGVSTLSLAPAAVEMDAPGGLAMDAATTEQAQWEGNLVKLPVGMEIKSRLNKFGDGSRRLSNGGLFGQKPMLVVKVVDVNDKQRSETPKQISDDIFGTSEYSYFGRANHLSSTTI